MAKFYVGDVVATSEGIGTVHYVHVVGLSVQLDGYKEFFYYDQVKHASADIDCGSNDAYGYFIIVSESAPNKPQRTSNVFRDGYHARERAKKLAACMPGTKFRVFRAYTAFEAVSTVSEVPL